MAAPLYFPLEIVLPVSKQFLQKMFSSKASQKKINLIMFAKCLKIFSHHSTPITHEFGLSIIIISQNSSGFHIITGTKINMELKKKLSVSYCDSLTLKTKRLGRGGGV